MRLPLITLFALACAIPAHAQNATRSLTPNKALSLAESPCRHSEKAFFKANNLAPVAVIRSLVWDIPRRNDVYYPVVTWANPQGEPIAGTDENFMLPNNVASSENDYLAYTRKAENGLWLVIGQQEDGAYKGTLLLHEGPTACREEPIFEVKAYELPPQQYRLMGGY